jgi:hypothetical protein
MNFISFKSIPMRNTLLMFFLVSVMVSCKTCKDDCPDSANPDCPNYVAPDPCANAVAASAEFTTSQSPDGIGVVIQHLIPFQRNCFTGASIVLSAQKDSCIYKWIVGADIYTTREVVFFFQSTFQGQDIPISLIVTDTTVSCPNVSRIDTVTKILSPQHPCDGRIWGKYYGTWEDNPTDSFAVEIRQNTDPTYACEEYNLIIGLRPHTTDTCVVPMLKILYNYISFDEVGSLCYFPIGSGILDSTYNRIRIDYTISDSIGWGGSRSAHVFNGYRIN